MSKYSLDFKLQVVKHSLSGQEGQKATAAREKAQAVNELSSQYSLSRLLNVAELPKSTFYWQLSACKKPDKYADDKRWITALFHNHKGRYGYRRITLASRIAGTH